MFGPSVLQLLFWHNMPKYVRAFIKCLYWLTLIFTVNVEKTRETFQNFCKFVRNFFSLARNFCKNFIRLNLFFEMRWSCRFEKWSSLLFLYIFLLLKINSDLFFFITEHFKSHFLINNQVYYFSSSIIE